MVLIDANTTFVEESNKLGLEAYVVNIYDDDLTDNIELNDIGYLLDSIRFLFSCSFE